MLHVVKIGVLGQQKEEKAIKSGISVHFSCIKFVFNITATYIYPRIHILFNINKLKMNKGDLIEAIAKGSDLTKADAGRALDATIEAITKTLKKGDKVTLPGFGTFSTSKRAARRQCAVCRLQYYFLPEHADLLRARQAALDH